MPTIPSVSASVGVPAPYLCPRAALLCPPRLLQIAHIVLRSTIGFLFTIASSVVSLEMVAVSFAMDARSLAMAVARFSNASTISCWMYPFVWVCGYVVRSSIGGTCLILKQYPPCPVGCNKKHFHMGKGFVTRHQLVPLLTIRRKNARVEKDFVGVVNNLLGGVGRGSGAGVCDCVVNLMPDDSLERTSKIGRASCSL